MRPELSQLTSLIIEPGLPKNSPTTSPYFSHPPHSSDQYSISFTMLPKTDIPGNALLFGNDFDKPVRDHLPLGFKTALGIVKSVIDPGIDGDAYADKPYLYGPALSSVNVFRVGKKQDKLPAEETETVIAEGGDEDGQIIREEKKVPDAASARKKFFLNETHRKEWTFEKGRLYHADFFNPFLDFNHFALKLPGFSLKLMSYWDGQPLRYVLKNRDTGDVYLAVVFTLLLKEDLEREEAERKGDKDTVEGKPEGQTTEPTDDDVD